MKGRQGRGTHHVVHGLVPGYGLELGLVVVVGGVVIDVAVAGAAAAAAIVLVIVAAHVLCQATKLLRPVHVKQVPPPGRRGL